MVHSGHSMHITNGSPRKLVQCHPAVSHSGPVLDMVRIKRLRFGDYSILIVIDYTVYQLVNAYSPFGKVIGGSK